MRLLEPERSPKDMVYLTFELTGLEFQNIFQLDNSLEHLTTKFKEALLDFSKHKTKGLFNA